LEKAGLTSVDNVVLVEIVYGLKYLFDRFCGVLFSELALLTNAIEELSARREFCDDVVLVLSNILRRRVRLWMRRSYL
jgi:hypothetical protein